VVQRLYAGSEVVRVPVKDLALGLAYVIRAGRIEATVNMARQSVRFITRDEQGLERGSCEMFLSEWSAIAEAIVTVAEKLQTDEQEASDD
jgi:hypothetical protein